MISIVTTLHNQRFDFEQFVRHLHSHNNAADFEICVAHLDIVNDDSAQLLTDLKTEFTNIKSIAITKAQIVTKLRNIITSRNSWDSDITDKLDANLTDFENETTFDPKTMQFRIDPYFYIHEATSLISTSPNLLIMPCVSLLGISVNDLSAYITANESGGDYYGRLNTIYLNCSNFRLDKINKIIDNNKILDPNLINKSHYAYIPELYRDYKRYTTDLGNYYLSDNNFANPPLQLDNPSFYTRIATMCSYNASNQTVPFTYGNLTNHLMTKQTYDANNMNPDSYEEYFTTAKYANSMRQLFTQELPANHCTINLMPHQIKNVRSTDIFTQLIPVDVKADKHPIIGISNVFDLNNGLNSKQLNYVIRSIQDDLGL